MAMLTQHPAQCPRSTSELLRLAQSIELRTASRYRSLSETMRRRGEDELARLFAFLAGVEDKHRAQITARAPVPMASEPPPSMVGTGLPEFFDEEAAARPRSRPTAPWR